MNAYLLPSRLGGVVAAPTSKSVAHRVQILSFLASGMPTERTREDSDDILATHRCLEALAAHLAVDSPDPCVLDCGESGSTLRFLLPVVCALNVSARFVRRGRLADRPLAPLDSQLIAHGARLSCAGSDLLAEGPLAAGRFTLPGNVSSQYVSGLLMAACALDAPSEVLVTKPVESAPYIGLTISALEQFGQSVVVASAAEAGVTYLRYRLSPQPLRAPETLALEGDWSAAAFWLAAGSLEPEGITVSGLNLQSAQGDRSVLAALAAQGTRIARRGNAARASADAVRPRAVDLDVSAIPDLVPPLAAVAARADGVTRLRNAGRLRLKESDRLESVCATINALGGQAQVDGDDLVIAGVDRLAGGSADSWGDHRIAMLCAVLAARAAGPVTLSGAESVAKSYPAFWEHYQALGGRVRLDSAE